MSPIEDRYVNNYSIYAYLIINVIGREIKMTNIKLKDYCKKNSITYITGYRWFKNGQIPGAYQTDSGTILVPDDYEAPGMKNTSNDAMSFFLKKVVEFSKSNSTVENFAAFVISNFQLKLIDIPIGNKFPKIKTTSEKAEQFVFDKLTKEILEQQSLQKAAPFIEALNEQEECGMTDRLFAVASTENLINPLKIATAGSSNAVFFNSNSLGGNFPATTTSSLLPAIENNCWIGDTTHTMSTATPFYPHQPELFTSSKIIETAETQNVPRKRGRKPTLKRDK